MTLFPLKTPVVMKIDCMEGRENSATLIPSIQKQIMIIQVMFF